MPGGTHRGVPTAPGSFLKKKEKKEKRKKEKKRKVFSDWSPKVQDLEDLVESFQTSIYLQNLASIQPRTGLSKFAKKIAKAQRLEKEVRESIDLGVFFVGRDAALVHNPCELRDIFRT